jgi:hypothetical protein
MVKSSRAEPLSAEETWRPVAEHPGYSVSTLGRVMGPRGWPLKPFKDADGYLRIGIKRSNAGVHRLVASAFLGPRPAGCEVAHKDHDRTNNRPGNLEYLTHGENVRASARAGRAMQGENHVRAVLTWAKVEEIRAGFPTNRNYRAWARRYGVSWGAIRHVVLGNTWRGSAPLNPPPSENNP